MVTETEQVNETTTDETPNSEIENPTPPEEEPEPSAVGEATEPEPEVSPESAVEDEEPEAVGEFDRAASAAKVLGESAVPSEPAAEQQGKDLPGRPWEEVYAEEEEKLSQSVDYALQRTDNDVRWVLQNEFDLTPEQAHQAWQRISPYWRALKDGYPAFNARMLNQGIERALSQDELKVFSSRAYQDDVERIRGVAQAAREAERAKWQEQVSGKGRKYVSLAEMAKIQEQTEQDYEAHLQKQGRLRDKSAPGSYQGTTPGGRSFRSEHELNVAYNNNEIDTPAYAREYKRLTGREP